MQQQNNGWVQNPDGTAEPTEELLAYIRANREAYPTVIPDFANITGRSEDEVQRILDNPYRAGNGNEAHLLSGVGQFGASALRGLGEGAGILLDKVGAGEAGQFVKDVTNIDPAFDTERNLNENIGEVFGQIAPTIGAAVAAAPAAAAVGAGVVGTAAATAVAGAVATTMTFEDEDNLLNAIDEWTGGVPEYLTVNPEDDVVVGRTKHLLQNLVIEGVTAGLGAGVAKLIGRIRKGSGSPDEVAQEIADAGFTPTDTPVPSAAVENALGTLTKTLDDQTYADEAISPQTRSKKATEALQRDLIARTTGQYTPVANPALANKFVSTAVGIVEATMRGNQKVLDRAARQTDATDNILNGFKDNAKQVYDAWEGGRYQEALQILQSAKVAGDKAHYLVEYQNAIIRTLRDQLDDNITAIVKAVRDDPTIKNKAVWQQIAGDYQQTMYNIHEYYREIGKALSHSMLTRKEGVGIKGTMKPSDVAKWNAQVQDEIIETAKGASGIKITKNEYMLKELLGAKELGGNPLAILEFLEGKWDNFEKAAAGDLANMSKGGVPLNREVRDGFWMSLVKFANDIRARAMLGQVSTTGMEVGTNVFQNISLPFVQHILGKGDFKRAGREYLGYANTFDRMWFTFKESLKHGDGKFDDFTRKDGSFLDGMTHTALKEKGVPGHIGSISLRLWSFAGELTMASGEATAAHRAAGIAWADGYDMAIQMGMKKPQAKKYANDYTRSKFNEAGNLIDPVLKVEVQQDAWRSVIDTRYMMGRVAQHIEQYRQSESPVIRLVSHMVLPFYRTLINIQGQSMQYINPIPGPLIRQLEKTQWGQKLNRTFKFMDDLSGHNGLEMQAKAQGRQNLGMASIGLAVYLQQSGAIQITGPSPMGMNWESKQMQDQVLPASSLIIGGKSYDLTRMLPFSAPLMLSGMINDTINSQKNRMKGGEWQDGPGNPMDALLTYGSALFTLSYSMFSDAGGVRGVGDLMDAVNKAASNQDPRELAKFGESYVKSFQPGAYKTWERNQGALTGDWTQKDAYDYLTGFTKVLPDGGGYVRLDMFGHPVIDEWRGVDPLNTKNVKTDDPLYMEAAHLAATTGLATNLPDAFGVFTRDEWKDIGVGSENILLGKPYPGLHELKTKDGQDAYDVYRTLVYKAAVAEEVEISISASGDGKSIGRASLFPGETYEKAMRRLTDTPWYRMATPDGRQKVWHSVFNYYKKQAKDHLKAEVVVDPSIFDNSTYGAPITQPTPLGETLAKGQALVKQTQLTGGSPLDQIFNQHKE